MSTFRNALAFFDTIGVYDVVLPFLLIFTLVFAMLEKTKMFGKEDSGISRKNLNAMVAFCAAFLVVASSQLVSVINETVAKSMVLLVMAVLFMVLVGSFSQDKPLFLEGRWNTMFMIIMFAGVSLILLYSLGWLQYAYDYASSNLDGPVFGSIVLLVIVLAFMIYVTGSSKGSGSGSDSSGGGSKH